MSIIRMPISGKAGGGRSEKSMKQLEIPAPARRQDKVLYVKITPNTELYIKVQFVARLLAIKPTRAARMMMRNGWLGFKRFALEEGMGIKNADNNQE